MYRLILDHMLFHHSSPPASFTASMNARRALSTAMCIRKSLAARQESRGLMSSFTAWANALRQLLRHRLSGGQPPP